MSVEKLTVRMFIVVMILSVHIFLQTGVELKQRLEGTALDLLDAGLEARDPIASDDPRCATYVLGFYLSSSFLKLMVEVEVSHKANIMRRGLVAGWCGYAV